MFLSFTKESFIPSNSNISESSNKKKRIEFIDLAKGICIILVVLLHVDSDIFSLPNFAALRMPLYFVLSGLFFKSYETKVFYNKKINNILVPLFFWIIIFDIIRWASKGFHSDFAFLEFLMDPQSRIISCNLAIWFLLCLFITNIIFFYLCKLKSLKLIALSIMVLVMIDFQIGYNNIFIPFWIDSALSALPFFFFGYCIQKYAIFSRFKNKYIIFDIAILCILISYGIYFIFQEPHIQFRENVFIGFPLCAYFNSAFYVIGILFLCKLVNWLPIISYLGKYSIVVLCLHNPCIGIFQWIANKFFHISIPSFTMAILILTFCLIMIPVLIKFLPKFVAQKPLFKLASDSLVKSSVF